MKYYINIRADAEGRHEIHREYCYFLPESRVRKLLGIFFLNESVIAEARKFVGSGRFDGCIWCCGDIRRSLIAYNHSVSTQKLLNRHRCV